jgi:hypothetical protein
MVANMDRLAYDFEPEFVKIRQCHHVVSQAEE